MKQLIPTVAFAFLSSLVSAQLAPGDVVVAGHPSASKGGGLFVVDPVAGKITPLTGVAGDLKWAYAIDQNPWVPSAYIVGTTGADQTPAVDPNIYRVFVTTGKVLLTKKLNSVALAGDGRIRDLAVVGNEIFFITNKRLARMPLAGGQPTTIATPANTVRHPSLGTDGRYLFTNFDSSGYNWNTCYRVDPQDVSKWTQHYRPQGNFPTSIWAIKPAADGNILVLDKGNFSGPDVSHVDSITGSLLRKFGMFPPHFSASEVVEDPGTRNMVVIGSGDVLSTWRDGKLVTNAFGGGNGDLKSLTVRRAPWLHRFGFQCKTSSPEPSVFASSVPASPNASYKLVLKAKGGSAGLFLLGIHGQLPAPISLAALGMGQCELGVLPLLISAIAVPPSGTLDAALPIPANFGPVSLDIQFALIDQPANTGGMVTTQVGSIIIR